MKCKVGSCGNPTPWAQTTCLAPASGSSPSSLGPHTQSPLFSGQRPRRPICPHAPVTGNETWVPCVSCWSGEVLGGQRRLQVRENTCLSRRGHGVGAVAVLPFLRHGSFPAQQRKKNDCKSVRHCTKQVEVCYTDAHSQTFGIRHLPGNICPLPLLDMIRLTLTGCFYVLGSLLNTTCICPSKSVTEGLSGSFVIVEEIQAQRG